MARLGNDLTRYSTQTIFVSFLANLFTQEASAKPGINDSFVNPDAKEFIEKLEIESREVFSKQVAIVKACRIENGITLADIGAGTRLFSGIFAAEVGREGRILAVDIEKSFLEHIDRLNRESGRNNVQTLQCSADSTKLPPQSIDVAFISDTYHHFEFPLRTGRSLHAALKPSGRVILIDFKRIEGGNQRMDDESRSSRTGSILRRVSVMRVSNDLRAFRGSQGKLFC